MTDRSGVEALGVSGVERLRARAESVVEVVSYRGRIVRSPEKGTGESATIIWTCSHRHETLAEGRLCAEGEIIRRGAEEEQKRWQ